MMSLVGVARRVRIGGRGRGRGRGGRGRRPGTVRARGDGWVGGDDVPDRAERLELVSLRGALVARHQVRGEVVDRLAVQRELKHAVVAEGPELALDPRLGAQPLCGLDRYRQPESPAVRALTAGLLADDVVGRLALERVDGV